MIKRVGKISGDATIMDAVKDLYVRNIGALVVFSEDTEIVGMFTERDILRRVIPKKLKVEKTRVSEVMTIGDFSGFSISVEAEALKLIKKTVKTLLMIKNSFDILKYPHPLPAGFSRQPFPFDKKSFTAELNIISCCY